MTKNKNSRIDEKFEDLLDATDFGVVLNENGELKGMYIPSEDNFDNDREIPENFLKILQMLGVNLSDEEQEELFSTFDNDSEDELITNTVEISRTLH